MSSVLITGLIEYVSTAALPLSIIIFSAFCSHEVRNLLVFLCNSDQVSVFYFLSSVFLFILWNVIVLLSVLVVLYPVTNIFTDWLC